MATAGVTPLLLSKQPRAAVSSLEERTPQDVFTPEDFTDEQRQIAETASNFAQNGDSAGGRCDRSQGLRGDARAAARRQANSA